MRCVLICQVHGLAHLGCEASHAYWTQGFFSCLHDLNSFSEWTVPAEGPLGNHCSHHERMWEFCLREACDLQVSVMFGLLSVKMKTAF